MQRPLRRSLQIYFHLLCRKSLQKPVGCVLESGRSHVQTVLSAPVPVVWRLHALRPWGKNSISITSGIPESPAPAASLSAGIFPPPRTLSPMKIWGSPSHGAAMRSRTSISLQAVFWKLRMEAFMPFTPAITGTIPSWGKASQVVMHAVSDDLKQWKKNALAFPPRKVMTRTTGERSLCAVG